MNRRRNTVVDQPREQAHARSRGSATANRRERSASVVTAAATTRMVEPFPPELKADLRRLLAEALVRDYLSENKQVSKRVGERAAADANPTRASGRSTR